MRETHSYELILDREQIHNRTEKTKKYIQKMIRILHRNERERKHFIHSMMKHNTFAHIRLFLVFIISIWIISCFFILSQHSIVNNFLFFCFLHYEYIFMYIYLLHILILLLLLSTKARWFIYIEFDVLIIFFVSVACHVNWQHSKLSVWI